LVGMVKGPSLFNPRRQPERAKKRRDLVIQMLEEQGVITEDQAGLNIAKPLDVTVRGTMADTSYPAFMDLIKRQLRADYQDEDLTSEGLRIFTSFDPLLQLKAEQAVETAFKRLGDRAGKEMEAAMVVTGAQTGEVLALVGGRNPR